MTRQDRWTSTEYADNGGVRLAYDRFEGSHGEPLLLVMGLATSRFWWPDGLCQAFADQGFEVARYDQRDAGESTRMPDTTTRNPFAALLGKKGDAYTSEDMVDDAAAVLDGLGWDRAVIFGHSMGGLIAQRIALRHPDRVRAVVSSAAVPSDVSGLRTMRYLRFGLLSKLARAKFPEGREGDIEAGMAVARGVASPGYPFDEERVRAWVEQQADSGPRDEKAQGRQIGAQWHGAKLSELSVPTLVLHGEDDPILKVAAARAVSRAISGSRLITWPGVGHDIPEALWPRVAAETKRLLTPAPVP
ncbi:alpha/beta fold hydrolase [Luteipulveratus mongoliensis]|uniref:Hydrolase n=1 Tax=Luteipulveratus mongoliensis TaxID=571913 RepID=A0A0K1JGP7_9MICO|nr:alpha/beta hydrolase [Luteipulveratus mongoliensis]AKU15889.1 hydrolase [Luteipulveratus mongoliensis]